MACTLIAAGCALPIVAIGPTLYKTGQDLRILHEANATIVQVENLNKMVVGKLDLHNELINNLRTILAEEEEKNNTALIAFCLSLILGVVAIILFFRADRHIRGIEE